MISILVTLVAHAAAWTNEWILAEPELQSIPSDAGREGVLLIHLSLACAGSTALCLYST